MKLFGILKNKEAKNASWLIGGRILEMGLSLLVSVLTVRYLGPANYGLVSYGNAYVIFFVSLCYLGLDSVITRDFLDHPDEQGTTIGTVLTIRLISSIVCALLTFAIVCVLDRGEPLTITVVVLCSLGPVFHIFDTFTFWFKYQYKSKVVAIASLLSYATSSGYKILLLILGKDVRWFAFAVSVDYIVLAIFMSISYRWCGGAKLSFSLQKAKNLLLTSYHYVLSSMMISLYGHIDKLMLKQMLDEREVGYYSTAVVICTMTCFVQTAMIDSIYPTILRLKKTDQAAYQRKNRQLYALIFYYSLLVSLFFTIFSKFIVQILYGEAYLPSAPILSIVTWYTAFSYLGNARNAWIVCECKQNYLKYISGCAVIMNISINLVLIPRLGACGAALASVITQVITNLILPFFFREMRPNAKLMLQAIFLQGIR